MAANPNSNDKIFVGKKGRVVYADPISWISPDANNNSSNEDNSDYDGSDDNNDAAIITTPTRRIVSPSTASTRNTRRSKTFPAEWIDNWEVEERPRSSGIRTDKFYHHKKEGFTCRSMKDVEKYEKDGTMPERKRKREGKGKEIEIINDEKEVDGNIAKKKKQESEKMRIRVEEFLAESHNNLLRWFDS